MDKDWTLELVEIMRRLRAPDGCPWDREQTHTSLKRYLTEEAAELLDAIDEQDDEMIVDELADVLLQVVFHAQIAEEQQRFTFQDVARHCCEKLVRRHPHVFGDREAKTSAAVLEQWKEIKWEERKRKEEGRAAKAGVLSGVPRSLPALHRAHAMQKKAAHVGFDWPSIDGVLAKIDEELAEVREALVAQDSTKIGQEIGDLLFSVVNLSRFTDQMAEELLHDTIRKFERRFAYIEARLREEGKAPEQCTLAELDALWDEAKKETR